MAGDGSCRGTMSRSRAASTITTGRRYTSRAGSVRPTAYDGDGKTRSLSRDVAFLLGCRRGFSSSSPRCRKRTRSWSASWPLVAASRSVSRFRSAPRKRWQPPRRAASQAGQSAWSKPITAEMQKRVPRCCASRPMRRAEQLRDILSEFAGLSANATAQGPQRRGLPSARGGKWTARSVINVRARLAD